MGFRTGAYAMVWEIIPKTDKMTRARISISRKDRQTGGYIQDFGDYVAFIGTANAAAALRLQPKDRIKLGDVDATTKYDKEKNEMYHNYNIYTFEVVTDRRFSNDDQNTGGNTGSSDPFGGFSNEPDPDVMEESFTRMNGMTENEAEEEETLPF